MGSAPLWGSCEGGKVPAPGEVPSLVAKSAGTEGELQSLGGEHSTLFAERYLHRRSVLPALPSLGRLSPGEGRGWVLRLRLQRSDPGERTGVGCVETASTP